MAKQSVIARQVKKKKLVEYYAKKRLNFKKLGNLVELQKLPKNSSAVRLRNLCSLTGRSRGYMRLYGVSRIKFRELASQGYIPGVKKSSW